MFQIGDIAVQDERGESAKERKRFWKGEQKRWSGSYLYRSAWQTAGKMGILGILYEKMGIWARRSDWVRVGAA
jgi:hypothetical protein